VLVSIDTLRADHLGCYGYERPVSPALDALAAEGIVFENTVAQCTWTTPSHAALMTSRYPTELGLRPWPEPGRIPDEFPTLAEVLRAADFRTRAFTESGWMSGRFGFARGFEEYDDRGGHFRKIVPRAELSLPDLVADRFFLFLHTYDVHWYDPPMTAQRGFVRPYSGPLRPSDELRRNIQKHGNRDWVEGLTEADRRYLVDLYDASIRHVDGYIARIVEALREQGVWDKCVFVVTSDHGEEFFERGRTGHGFSNHEEQVRVPLIVRLPNGAHAGKRIREPVASIDLMPTILELLAIEEAPDGLRGRSLVPLLRGGEENRPVFTDRGHTPERSLRTEQWKVIRDEATGRDRIYDLEEDPGEERDLSDAPSDAARRARDELARWIETLVPPSRPADAGPLTPEERERIRALGYLDDADAPPGAGTGAAESDGSPSREEKR
jgi:arylsulfatase A-like enzyme